MKKLTSLTYVLCSIFLFSCEENTQLTEDEKLEDQAYEIAHKYIITDGHVDLPYRLDVRNFKLTKEFIGIPIETDKGYMEPIDMYLYRLSEKKNKIITESEKKTIAFHEAGHATVSWFLEHAAPLVKVTIVPRGQSLGAAWYLPEERQIVKPEQILDEMCAALGGRAAEKVMFNNISTGALSDLEKVTKQARSMVTVYGLNDKIGNLTYYDSSGQNDYGFTKPYSDVTAQIIDKEISNIIETQYERAIKLLEENKEKLTELAEVLLKKEVIFKDNLEAIFGKRPFVIEQAVKQISKKEEEE